MTLKEEYESVSAQIAALEKRQQEILEESLTVPEEDKAAPDYLATALTESPVRKPFWPKEIIGWTSSGSFKVAKGYREPGFFVKIRTVNDGEEGTHLGVSIGDGPLSVSVRVSPDGVAEVSPAMHNPAFWVPALGRVVYGCESWWGQIKSPDDLKDITDQDIENVWYVQALKSLEET